MAESAKATLNEMKTAMSANNPVYATLKVQYTGSWYEDIVCISNMVGVPISTLISLNPWLKENNFVANSHDYITIKVSGGTPSGVGSNQINGTASGYYATDGWIFPLGVGTWYVTQGYHSGHTGLDLTTGTPGEILGAKIYAVKAGEVVQAYTSDSWGNTILIKHTETVDSSGNCYFSRYAHMRDVPTLKVGDKVSQGDIIGYVGNTGKSTGAHLHFHIYYTTATRTDYTNFTGTSDFGVDPNTIPNFPGKPLKSQVYSKVDFVKSDFITSGDIDVINGATKGDGSVTQEEVNNTIQAIVKRVLDSKGLTADSDLGKLIRDFIDAQIRGIVENGVSSAVELLQGGNFETVLNNFCQSVVDNAVWYVQNKINQVIDEAIAQGAALVQEKVEQGKQSLRTWVWSVTKTDPNSELANSVGRVLDTYVDTIIDLGWNALYTGITTGDVKTAAGTFLEQLKDYSIDYVVDLGTNAAVTAITSYIGSSVQSTELQQIAADLGVGIVNTVGWAIGAVLKGDISLEEAAKNVVIQVTSTVVTKVVQSYLVPVITNWISVGLSYLLAQVGISVGAEVLGGYIGGPIGALAAMGVSWLFRQLFG